MEVALIIADASIFISLDLRIYEMAAFCFSTRHDRADWVIIEQKSPRFCGGSLQ